MRYTPKYIFGTVTVLSIASLLTACGDSSEESGGNSECEAPLTVAHATSEVWGLAPKLAEAEGFFEDHGVEIDEQVLFEGDSQVAQALQAGQAQVGLASGYPVLATLDSGRPMVVTGLLAVKETDMLVAKPDIQSPEDLVGKTMAINDIGGGTHAATAWALEELGVNPDDVTFTMVGAEADRLAAVIGGSAATGPVDRTQRDAIEKEGLHVLIDLSETDITSAKHGVIFRRDFVDACPDTVEAFMRALADAQDVMLHNPERAGEVLAEWGEFDTADGVAIVEDVASLLAATACMQPTEEAMQKSLDFLKTQNDAVADVDVTDAITTEFTDKLAEDGTVEELGIECVA